MPAVYVDYDKKIIERLQDAYAAAYTRFVKTRFTQASSDFGARGYNRRNKSDGRTVWETVLNYARRHHVSPFALLCVTFDTWYSREPPRPQHMLSPHVLANLASYAKEKEFEVRIALNGDKSRYGVEMALLVAENNREKRPKTELRLHTTVLANDYLQISPLFRYCLARQLQLQPIVEATREAADNQFAEYPPAYLSIWGDLLTKRHRVTMARIYACKQD